MVVPSACVANKAMIGNSSIKRGISAPWIMVALSVDEETVIVADSFASSISLSSNLPPIASNTSKIPVRVGLIPTFFKTT